MNDLETRQLRYFCAVAEELHFGRAAERLGIAQPPLSRAIGALERQLGVALFVRSTRQVSLTPAGAVLLDQARIALDAVTAAARRTRRAGRTEPVLRVALKADYDAGLLPRVLRAYDHDPDAVPVELVLGGRGEQIPALQDGRADVALVATPFHATGLETEHLLTEPRLLALAADDPLAAATHLHLSDLAGRTLPDGAPAERGLSASDRTSYESIGLATPSEGPAPDTEQGQLDLAQIFSLVELGRVVLFVPASVAHRHQRADLSYREVVDLPPATLSVAWPVGPVSRPVAAFVRAAVLVAREHESTEAELAAREALSGGDTSAVSMAT